MARTSVPTQVITRAGLTPNLTAPIADGDVIDVGAVSLEVKNASGAPVTVTVESPLVVEGLNVEELAVAVPAGGEKRIGPLPSRVFARPVGSSPAADIGRAYVNYSAVAGITRAVTKLGS